MQRSILIIALAGSMTSCGLGTVEVINDLNIQLKDEGEI